MKPKGNASFIVILITGLVLFILFLFSVWRPWYEVKKDEINVGYLPIYVDLPLFVAVEEGFFENRDIKVKLIRYQSSPDMASALVSNDVDAVASIATSSALAVESRDPGKFKIFVVDAETPENPLSSLVISSKSNINNPSELKGKLVASFPGPTASLFAPLAFEKYGLKKDDYDIQELQIGSHITALETGKVDALVTYEPTATQAVIKYGAKKLVSGFIEKNVISPWQAGIWIISSSFLKDNKDMSESFVLAIYDAIDFIRNNPDKAKESLSRYTKIDIDIANKTPTIPFTKVWEVDLVTLQKHSDLLTEEGILKKEIDVPLLMMSELPKQ